MSKRPSSATAREIRITMGMKIRITREVMGITQAELANKIGLTRTMICSIEAGRCGVTVERLIAIAAALDQSPQRFLP